MNRLWVTPVFFFRKKCTEWPQMTLTCSKSKVHTCIPDASPMPKFSSLSLYDETFLVTPFFRKRALNDPKWPWHVQGKNTNMHATCTLEVQIIVRFALKSAVIQLRPKFGKSTPNDPNKDLDMFTYAYTIHPWGPNFHPFHSVMSLFFFFLSYAPIFRKSAPNDSK